MKRKIVWLSCGGLLALCALVADPAALFPGLTRSWFFQPARVAELRVALGVLGAIVAAAPWWLAFLRREPRTGPREPSGGFGAEAFCLVLLLALAALAWTRDEPLSKDTKFYLGEALDIARHGGVPGLLGRCLDGSWAEDNRGPLYLALLAPWAAPSNAFLAAARAISFAGAALTLLLAMRACRRRAGGTAALACGVVLATNAAFVEHSILVACESWWTAFAVLAVDLATRDGERRPWARWAGAGACIGLAFLTKGTGVLLLLAAAAWILWTERRRAWTALAPLCAGFALAAWPLLVRNQLRFQDPLWNVNSRRAFWLDRWEQFFDPAAMEQASASRYFATHSATEALSRFALGAVKVLVHLLEACAPFASPAWLGLPVLVLVASAVLAAGGKQRSFLVLLALVWLASFAWYAQIASDRRFLAVLLPLAAPALGAWTSRARGASRSWRPVTASAWAIALALAAWSLSSARHAFRFEPAPWNAALHAWLREPGRNDRDAIYLLGPSADLGFDWDSALTATRRARPLDGAQLQDWLGESTGSRFRFLVVEAHAGPRRFGDAWVDVAPSGELTAARAPADWQPVARFPQDSPRALVFERR